MLTLAQIKLLAKHKMKTMMFDTYNESLYTCAHTKVVVLSKESVNDRLNKYPCVLNNANLLIKKTIIHNCQWVRSYKGHNSPAQRSQYKKYEEKTFPI